jgi:hypothetical protein
MAVAPYMANAYLSALAESDPLAALREVVRHELHDRHANRDVVLQELETLRGDLRNAGRLDDEDVVLEVMDFVAGWCSPHARL